MYEDEYVELAIDEDIPCLEWIGKIGFISSKEFRLSEEKSLEFYLEYNATYPNMGWFVDARAIGALSPMDTQWVIDEILPKFAAAGLKKEAFVIPKSALGKITVDQYKSNAGHIIEIRMFGSAKAAKAWLKE